VDNRSALNVKLCIIGEFALNDELVNREDMPSPSVSPEPASSPGLPSNNTFKVRDASERPGRKEKSAFRKFVPPILGGLAALPLATAILWYGFGKDLGGMGPSVAQYAPWIVPKKLRGNGFRSDGTFGSSYSGSGNSGYDVGPVPDISPKRLASDGFKSALPSLGSESRPVSPGLAPAEDKSAASTGTDPLPTKSEKTDVTKRDASEPVAAGAEVTTETKRTEETKRQETVQAQMPDVENSSPGAIPSLSQSLRELTDLKEKWPSIPRERAVQIQAIADFYGHLCDLAKWIDSPEGEVIELWNERRVAIASMILNDSKFSALTQRCASGEIPNIVSLESSRYVVTVIPGGIPLQEESVDVPKELTMETVIAGSPMTVEFPNDNADLLLKARSIDPGKPLLLFLRLDKHDEAYALTALDILVSGGPL
jgi:hypothetical protein